MDVGGIYTVIRACGLWVLSGGYMGLGNGLDSVFRCIYLEISGFLLCLFE